jgi:outer membrane lipoprotein carrier protein
MHLFQLIFSFLLAGLPTSTPAAPAPVAAQAAAKPANPPAAKPTTPPAAKPATPPAAEPAATPSRVSPLPGAAADPKPAAAISATAVVDKVQAFYKETGQLTAKFRQTVDNATFGRQTVSDGNVFIKKPGKMRWDYYSKARKTQVDRSFMSDGKVLWAVFIDGKTYYKKNLADDLLPVAITFLSGKGDLKTDFDAALDTSGKYGGAGDHVLALTPKKPSASYKTLWLVVDRTNHRVKKSVILNSTGDLTTFAFFEPNTTAPLKDQIFVFNEQENKKKGFRQVEPPKQ